LQQGILSVPVIAPYLLEVFKTHLVIQQPFLRIAGVTMERHGYPSLEPEQIGEAIRAFRAESCPACGGRKDLKSKPFCDECLRLLPLELRDRISDNSNFIETFHPAMKYLRSS
jgi:hypothetical protein